MHDLSPEFQSVLNQVAEIIEERRVYREALEAIAGANPDGVPVVLGDTCLEDTVKRELTLAKVLAWRPSNARV